MSYKLCELHEKWLLLQSLYSKPWLLSAGSSAFLCLIITRNMSIFIFGVYDKYTVQEKNECKREMNARLSLVNKVNFVKCQETLRETQLPNG